MARQKEATYITEQKLFPRMLRKLMNEKKASQAELSKFLGCTRQTISLYATGQSTPDIDILLKISQYFNVSTDFLLGITEVKSKDINVQAIHEKTGLSEEAITFLIDMTTIYNSFEEQDKDNPHAASKEFTNAEMISALIENINLMNVLPSFDKLYSGYKEKDKDILYDFYVFTLQNKLKDLIFETLEGLTIIKNEKEGVENGNH
jgi:transcriptional regulator with XRE-family HTH domain